MSERAATGDQEENINKLKDELGNNQQAIRDKIQQLESAKNEMEETFDKEIKELQEKHHIELEEKKNQYS